jgi:voltage-gated potassium channel
MYKFDDRISPVSHYKVAKGLFILMVILLIGSVGYMAIEGWDFLDSVYMTVITITTVGFGEVREVTVLSGE